MARVEPDERVAATVDAVEADDLRPQDTVADHASERRIAHRLDALDAERVIRRALELEAEALEQPHLFDVAQLERIAAEIGMDIGFVRQALGEIRLAPTERGRLDRWILPDDIIELATVQGLSRDELDTAIEKWMVGYEGLIRGVTIEGGARWDVDRRWSARLRAMRRAGGNRISRVAGGDVAHRVHSLSADEHVVALLSRGEGPLVAAKATMVLAVLVVFFGLVGSLGDGALQFAQWALTFLVAGAGIVAAGVFGARRWARGVGRALRRSLTGLTGLAGGAKPRMRNWFGLRRPQDGQ